MNVTHCEHKATEIEVLTAVFTAASFRGHVKVSYQHVLYIYM